MKRLDSWTRLVLVCLLASAGCAGEGDQGGASLSLVVDSPPRPVGSVSYDISCDQGDSMHDQFELLDDALSSIWETFIELPAGHCDVALTALDFDGAPLCFGELAFDLDAGEIAAPTVVLDCDEQQSGGNTTVIIEQININVCTVIVTGVRNIGGTGSLEDNSMGDLILEVTTIGQCSDADIDPEIIAEAIANDASQPEAGIDEVCGPETCDDGNECTEDVCLEQGCAFTEAPEGSSCNEGLGSCERGACIDVLDEMAPDDSVVAP